MLGDAPTVALHPGGQRRQHHRLLARATPSTHALGRADAHAAHARLAGRGRGADRARRAGAAPGDARHRDPDRQPGVVGRARSRRATSRAATSARSPTPRSSRPTGCSPPRRAASWSRRRRRRSPGCSQAAADGLVAPDDVVGVHGHRARAEGSEAGDRRGAGRRRGRRQPPTRSPAALRPVESMTTALVTGASAGIGRAFADALAGARPRPRPRRARRRAARRARRRDPRRARRRRRGARRRPPRPTAGLAVVEARLADGDRSRRHPREQRRLRHVRPVRRARRRRARTDEIRAQRGRAACGSPTPRSAAWNHGGAGAILNVVVARRVPADTRSARPTARRRRSCTASPTRCTRRRGAPACR